MKIKNKNLILAIVISVLTYLVFFYPLLSPSYLFISNGEVTDAQIKHLPARNYLYEKLVHEHLFPFWTEKMYSGFPIYADPENAYLNPINIISVVMFGPEASYKVLHFLEYLIGSLSLYFFLKRKGIGVLGYSISNVIFYFNTFFLNHQIHYNMVMALYLVPTVFLLADIFIEKRQLRYIVLESLVISNAVLWGHMQSVAIILMSLLAFVIIFSFRRIRLQTFIFFFVALFFLVAVETLPQVLPTYQLLEQSSRGEGTDFLKGSLNPRMAIFTFIPYLFGTHDNFIGRNVNTEYSYNEIYLYLGFSSFLLSTMVLLFLKKTREIVFAVVLVWIFLIFGFLGSNKFISSETPLVTLFREWQRTIVIAGLGMALLAGIFIERWKESSFKNLKAGIIFVALPVVYIWIMVMENGGKVAKKLGAYTSFGYIENYPFFHILEVIFLILIGVFLLIFIVRKKFPELFPKIILPAKIAIVAIVFFDLIFFSKDVLSLRLQKLADYKNQPVPEELENKRAIVANLNILGMESLYYGNWSPLGTSQLKESDYVDYYEKLGVNLRGSTSSFLDLPNDLQKLKEAGISDVVELDGASVLINNNLDIIKNDINGQYLEKKEGHVSLKINSPSDTNINTFLKYSPYWNVKVDNQPVKILKDGIFFDFPMTHGEHLVKIDYYPQPFFRALAISFFSLLLGIFLYFICKKPLYNNILK